MLVARETEVRRGGKNGTGDSARSSCFDERALCRGEAGQGCFRGRASRVAPGAVDASVGRAAAEAAALEGTTDTQASHGGRGELHPEPMGGAERILLGRSGAHRQ